MTNLRSSLHDIAVSFALGVYNAVRSASLDELREGVDGGHLKGGGGAKGGGEARGRRAAAPAAEGRSAKAAANGTGSSAGAARGGRGGRLHRRSSEEIASALDGVIALVKKNKDGLRAEQIRVQLGLEAKEMPRILKEGIASRKLRARGQKRATTYFAS
jgi:hypothetical protein